MVGQLLRQMIEGLFAPSASARRVLDAGYGIEAGALFAILGYTLGAILQALVPAARRLPEGAESVSIAAHAFNILLQLLLVWIIAMAVYGIGRLFGGTGDRRQAFVLVGWHALVTTLLAPLFLIGMSQIGEDNSIPASALFVLFVAGAQYLWVLACFTMQLHGFTSPWGIVGLMVAVMLLFSGLFMNLAEAG